MKYGPTTATILLVSSILASGSGCQVLGIPSYRSDSSSGMQAAYSTGAAVVPGCETGQFEEGTGCEPGIIPPLPGCFASLHAKKEAWKAERNLPEPAPYPRFHPLPTRPMFSPKPLTASSFGPPPDFSSDFPMAPSVQYGRIPQSAFSPETQPHDVPGMPMPVGPPSPTVAPPPNMPSRLPLEPTRELLPAPAPERT